MRHLLLMTALATSCSLWVSEADLCDPAVDRVRWFPDVDGDGFGDALAVGSCEALDNYVANSDDCDDDDPAFTSLQAMGDVGGRTLWYPDADNDGAGADEEPVRACAPPAGYGAPSADDCDDNNPAFSVVCPWVDVAVGVRNACGLRGDGSISCWGDTALALADTLPREGAIAIAGSNAVFCALYEDGAAVCTRSGWEYDAADAVFLAGGHKSSCAWDASGEYTCDDNGLTEWIDVDPPPGPVIDLAVGFEHACAVMADTSLHCWGNATGFEIEPPGGVGWTAVQAGRYFACASHEVDGVTCWGYDLLESDFAAAPKRPQVTLSGGGFQTCGLTEDGIATCWGVDPRWSTPPDLDEPVVAIDSSDFHGCLVTESGQLRCWGRNSRGQADPPNPEQRGVAAGGNTSCAVRQGGSVSCWGDTPQLDYAHTGVFVGHDRAASITAVGEVIYWGPDDSDLAEDDARRTYTALRGYGSRTTLDESVCALDLEGAIHCWPGYLSVEAYKNVPDGDGYIDVAPGALHGCALDASGAVQCWAHQGVIDRIAGVPSTAGFVQIDAGTYHTCAVHSSGRLACWGEDLARGVSGMPDGSRFTSVAVHEGSSCALDSDGRPTCWGVAESLVVSQVPDVEGLRQISVAHDQACAVTATGAVRCWGDARTLEPEAIAALSDVVQVSTGYSGLCVATRLGKVECIDSRFGGSLAPTPSVGPPNRVTDLAIGGHATCAVRRSRAQCWAEGDSRPTTAPASQVVAVAAGQAHACALDESGQVSCWGDAREGQTDVPDSRFRLIAAGGRHTCGVQVSGSVRCWGDLGADDGADLVDVTSLASGRAHACAIDGGVVVCWGADDYGQASPPPRSAALVTAGDYHSCALTSEGEAYCWGADTYGQVSDVPPYVFTELAAGAEHTCGVKLDGFASCWGRDLEEQATPPDPRLGL